MSLARRQRLTGTLARLHRGAGGSEFLLGLHTVFFFFFFVVQQPAPRKPALYSLSSAETFPRAYIQSLDKPGAIKYLTFFSPVNSLINLMKTRCLLHLMCR